MSHIIRRIRSPQPLELLVGPGNAQASFYFREGKNGALNASLYNNLLSRRLAGAGEAFRVRHVTTTSSAFANEYLSLYLRLRFSLSKRDRAKMDRLCEAVSRSIESLRPLWNSWVELYGRHKNPPVAPLDTTDIERALVEMTSVLQGRWLAPAYAPILRADPAFPYKHLDQFSKIFKRIPGSVSQGMRRGIRNVYRAQGPHGALTAQVSRATSKIHRARASVTQPSADNGGQPLIDSPRYVPGLEFLPADPENLLQQLSKDPAKRIRYRSQVTRRAGTSSEARLSVPRGQGPPIEIEATAFFSMGSVGRRPISVFNEPAAGSDYEVEVILRNPTLQPMMRVTPLPIDLESGHGWMDEAPIKEALRNRGQNDVTGFVFDGGVPPFNFARNGNFGRIGAIVLSQFLELSLTFRDCDAGAIEGYFRRHRDLAARFLGIPLHEKIASHSDRARARYAFTRRSSSCLTVEIRPDPPFFPPGPRISNSLCFLVAVIPDYPFS